MKQLQHAENKFNKVLIELEKAELELTKSAVKELQKRLKRCKANNWELISGMGSLFFTKNDNIIHWGNENELPKILNEIFEYWLDHEFFDKYVSVISKDNSNILDKISEE